MILKHLLRMSYAKVIFGFAGWHLDDMVDYSENNDKGDGESGKHGEEEGGGRRRQGGARRSRNKMMKMIMERFKLMKKWN